MSTTDARPARYLFDSDYQRFVPVHAVWEITLACDLKCLHCGSRAGHRRTNELSTAECLEVIDALARLGTREVSLIGGEAYLRKDWTQLIRAIRSHGMYCAIQTGGRNLTPKRLAQAVDAGLNGVGVSLDGLAPLHDKVRNVPGAFERALDTLRRARDAGIAVSVNTQIGAQTMEDLPALMDTIIELGATHWQIQLTVAMGNAVDNDELLLQPYRLAELMPLLAKLYKDGVSRGLLMTVGNNIGYYGPYEHLWRGFGDERVHWSGCAAGQNVIALEADGTVKGCPSLATVGFSGGNVRDMSLEDIWRTSEGIHFGRLRSVDDLWGFCRTCYYADVCRGGCTWTSHSLLGKPGNNPYCHYRVLELQKQGLRERIAKVQDAGPASFAVGRFDLVTERIADGEPVASVVRSGQVIELAWKSRGKRSPEVGRVPPKLKMCRNCDGYVHAGEQTCPHCGGDIDAAARAHELDAQRRHALMNDLERLLGLPASTFGGG
ncbi:radical SAM domain-containing protein [Burkholderia pseudomallei]|uniref:GDL motif peptide-associated radical SAM/SPASM maturase n=1 Tax=Burkholderia pseudomallei TaxID=28450 RepID=UPI0005DCDB79|nr:GDL motif peptide-associated radical SAM/SPASM maturase [Burkholderia pseudomallei]QUN90782.1 GDL motif peptide-associated radical SAM/SPASM maturase [Burkholderia pseudomallei]CPH25900.1 radical SAM domain-containing protein [Burkholderia pseudomallei]